MIKFLPFDIIGVSHRTLSKNENVVYGLQISALVSEIFKFEKCVKYANEMTDDVIHSTQYYIPVGCDDLGFSIHIAHFRSGEIVI